MHTKYWHPVLFAALLSFAALSSRTACAESTYTSASSPSSSLPEINPSYTSASAAPAAQNGGQDISVYNFNDASTNMADAGAANTALLLSVDRGSGTLTTNFNADDIYSNIGTTVNAGTDSTGATDPAGAALVLSPGFSTPDNNGDNITLAVSTLGFTNIILSFAAERTSTGFSSNQVQYSLNGTTYTNFGTAFDVPVISHGSNPYTASQFDLSAITGLNNNTQASVRIVFSGGTGSGNIRLDNLRLSGLAPIAAPEPGTNLTLLIGALLLARSAYCARARLDKQILTGRDH